jgi:hypothetical protein
MNSQRVSVTYSGTAGVTIAHNDRWKPKKGDLSRILQLTASGIVVLGTRYSSLAMFLEAFLWFSREQLMVKIVLEY